MGKSGYDVMGGGPALCGQARAQLLCGQARAQLRCGQERAQLLCAQARAQLPACSAVCPDCGPDCSLDCCAWCRWCADGGDVQLAVGGCICSFRPLSLIPFTLHPSLHLADCAATCTMLSTGARMRPGQPACYASGT